jgi:hypothetical protein
MNEDFPKMIWTVELSPFNKVFFAKDYEEFYFLMNELTCLCLEYEQN